MPYDTLKLSFDTRAIARLTPARMKSMLAESRAQRVAESGVPEKREGKVGIEALFAKRRPARCPE
jgi:hypothetical protein